jgi:hypothetical protein
MIIIDDTDSLYGELDPKLKEAVEQFAKNHKSEFPIHAEIFSKTKVRFWDTRFVKHGRSLANLTFNIDNDKKLRLTSTRIKNPKCKPFHSNYHAKISKNVGPIVKALREFVYPTTPVEMRAASSNGVATAHNEWQTEPMISFKELRGNLFDSDASLVAEFQQLLAAGAMLATEPFRKFAAEGVGLYAERERRNRVDNRYTSLCINPDNTIDICAPNGEAYRFGSVAELPPALSERLALLRMTEGETFVPEVGMKYGGIFWIYEGPNA